MRPSAFTGRLFFASVIVLLLLQPGFTRERGPRVEVVCPFPPQPVQVGEHQVLVYELHVTNFDVVPLTLKRLEIFGDTGKNRPLKVFSDDSLSGLMFEVGSKGGSKGSPTIAPGNRAVVFLWIALNSGEKSPRVLRHRMVFVPVVTGDGAVATDAILEDFPVPVGDARVPLLGSPFDGGVWLAGDLSNDSNHRRALAAIDGYVHLPERFAIDWVKVGPNGDSHDGTARNENWWGYNEPIHAVADGVVTQVVDGIPENTPRVLPQKVTLDNIAGNYVIVRIAPNLYVITPT